MDNKLYFLALNSIPNVGPRTVMRFLKRWPRLKELFDLTYSQLCNEGVPAKLAADITALDFRSIEKELQWQEQPMHHLLTWDDENYPSLLKEIYDPPVVLYAMGDLNCLHKPTLAMVGTRKPTVLGSEIAYQFACELGQYGVTVISGLALGIDGQVHRGCLQGGGKTVAVMGSGFNQIYPSKHVSLAQEISQTGLLLSEFPLHIPPEARHFPRRNRIISGLSLAIMIVEASIKSGSLITARLALEQNRDVFALPGSIYNPQARGCHQLLQQGAKLITSVQDVLSELGLNPSSIQVHKKLMRFSEGLASKNENLVKCIGYESTGIDQIHARSGLNIDEVTCKLAELELEGEIKAVSGGYVRCKL